MPLFTLPEDTLTLQKLALFAPNDREGFRLQAYKAFAAYLPTDRSVIKKIRTKQTLAYDVFAKWKTELYPLANELDAQLTKPTFHKALSRYLLLDESTALHKVDELVAERLQTVRQQLLQDLYSSSYKKDHQPRQYQAAHSLLSLPSADIDALRTRYTAYLLHKEIANLHSIDIIDPHTSWWKRYKTARHIKKERKQVVKLENTRLRAIDKRLTELQKPYNNIIGTITAKGWDLITIISLRNLYEKQLKTLPLHADAAKQLALFEKVTKVFCTNYIEKSSPESLSAAQAMDEEVSRLLLYIFELSTIDKNQLLLISKEVRDLTAEKETIQKARDHRHTILQKSA